MKTEGFNFLPKDIIVDILARVAANSMEDFFNAKMSCKIFSKLAEEDYVYRQISLDKISWIVGSHPEGVNAFIQRCIKCNNLEASYRQGLYEYIKPVKVGQGMELLKRAAQLGHLDASYFVGLLLVSEGSELKKEGVRLLRKVYVSRQVVECRKTFLSVLGHMLWNNVKIFREDPPQYDCPMQSEHCKRRGWVHELDHYDNTTCERCICRVETQLFYKYCKHR